MINNSDQALPNSRKYSNNFPVELMFGSFKCKSRDRTHSDCREKMMWGAYWNLRTMDKFKDQIYNQTGTDFVFSLLIKVDSDIS